MVRDQSGAITTLRAMSEAASLPSLPSASLILTLLFESAAVDMHDIATASIYDWLAAGFAIPFIGIRFHCSNSIRCLIQTPSLPLFITPPEDLAPSRWGIQLRGVLNGA